MKKNIVIFFSIISALTLCIGLILFSTEFKRQLFLAKRDHVNAQIFIAQQYTQRLPHSKQDSCQALYWWTKAAQHQHPQAKLYLGNLLIKNTTPNECLELNTQQIHDYILFATEQGNYAGYFKLSELTYLNTEQRIQYLEHGALRNDPNALYATALHYFYKNQNYSLNLLHRAAQQGHIHAQTFLGDVYAGMTYTNKHINYPQAVHWYTQAAEKNDVIAQKNLGLLYLYGQGSHQNYDHAAYWLQRASLQKDAEAKLTLAMLVLFDRGLTASQYGTKNNHIRIIRDLANQGYIDAQTELGRLHLLGIGTIQNYVRAAEWFQVAANQSDRLAKYQLGLLYQTGKGVPLNKDKARELLYQARYTEYLDTSKPNGKAVIDEGYPKFKVY